MWSFIGFGLALSAGIALAGIVFVVIPLGIFQIPYCNWVVKQQGCYNLPKQLPSQKLTANRRFFHDAKNAAKLYRSWITHKPHNITDW